MLRTTLAGLRTHKLRLLLTAVAIILGVGFIAGTFVLTDSMQAGIDKDFGRSASKVDVAVVPKGGPSDSDSKQVPSAVLGRIQGLPGVAEAFGQVRGDAALIGKDGKAYGDTPTLGLSIAPGVLQRYIITEGKVPTGPGDAVLDKRTAEKNGFKVGDTVTVLDHKGARHQFSVTGLVDFGIDQEVGWRGAVGFTGPVAAAMTGERGYTEIDLRASGDPGALRAAVERTAGGSYDVLTGRELGDRLAANAGADTVMLRTGLLLFGMVSVLVAALVIYNTFTILIAQRMRELALLRCVGATRRQVFGGVLVEAVVVGLVGAVIGIGAGVGLAWGGLAGLGALDDNLPSGDVTLTFPAVVIGILVGVVMTVLSALLPARAATRVAPVAALRAELEPGSGRFRLGWPRTVLTALFGLLGVAFAVFGSLVMSKGQAAMLVVALGGGLLFLAVTACMPALVRPLGRFIGALPARLAGVPGRLAVENARRMPRRTATTTIALTVGVGLMSLFAVVGASSKVTVDHKLAEQFPVDFQLHTQFSEDDSGQRVPRALAADLRTRPQIGAVIEVHRVETRVEGDPEEDVGSVTASALTGGFVKPEIKSGDLGALGPGTIAVDERAARRHVLSVGESVPIHTPHGIVSPKVVAVFGGDTPVPPFLVPETDFTRYFGRQDPRTLYVSAKAGVPAAAAEAAVEQAAKPYPAVKVGSTAALKEDLSRAIDTMLMIFGGMLGLAVLIALFGIANTLTLSVVERTRESALLRALGITKRQLRRMLSVEAFIMAVIGALTGVTLGVVFGWAATRAMMDGTIFALPYAQIVGFIALAGAAGMLAAVLPARRAARASIVESLAHD